MKAQSKTTHLVRINHDSEDHILGEFDTLKEAKQARKNFYQGIRIKEIKKTITELNKTKPNGAVQEHSKKNKLEYWKQYLKQTKKRYEKED